MKSNFYNTGSASPRFFPADNIESNSPIHEQRQFICYRNRKMTAIQRYGELELHVRLTNEVHNPIATTGYFGLHDSTYLVNKSYEECRLAYSVMAYAFDALSSRGR